MIVGVIPGPPSARKGFALMLHRFSNGAVAMTRHTVSYQDRGPQIGAGQAFTNDDLEELVGILEHRRDTGFELLPTSILGASAKHLVWYEKGGVRNMWFRVSGKSIVVRAPWPALVYMARKGSLHIAALKSNRRPTAATRLSHAPVMNIYSDGSMCTGNIILPDSLSADSIPKWREAVECSNGSHVNHDNTMALSGKTKVSSAEHLAFWRKLEREKAKVFPSANLSPMGITLGDFVGRKRCR